LAGVKNAEGWCNPGDFSAMTPHDNQMAARAIQPRGTLETMHSVNLRGMFGAFERLGYDVESLLAPFGLRRADVEDPDGRIPAKVCAEIFAAVKLEGRVKNLALRVAVEMPVGSHPLLDYLVCTSESVGEGLKQLARHLGLANPAIRLVFREEQDAIRVLVEGTNDPFTVELTVSLVLRMIRESGDQFRATRVCFRHEPENTAEFKAVLRCHIESRSPWSGFALTREA